MRVSEAEKKMCPFLQISVQQEDGTIHHGNIDCKTTDCMAWKEETEQRRTYAKKRIIGGYCQRLNN